MSAWFIGLLLATIPQAAPKATDYAADARALDQLISDNYACVERWPERTLPDSPTLRAEREAVADDDGLLRYAERRIASLADHHAITGPSFRTSWALVPTYADLWIVEADGQYRIDAVREGSPAANAGVRPGDLLVSVGGVAIDRAVGDYWAALGLAPTGERKANAARVLAAGRRDRPRQIEVARAGAVRSLHLPSLYAVANPAHPAVELLTGKGDRMTIQINNSLGDEATIAAFDQAMARVPRSARLTIDLTDTPSGGNTSVARAIMGWFTPRLSDYQVHILPSEERRTGIVRRWVEQVAPRPGKRYAGRPMVVVGRWTGSMGEGLAIGMRALGAHVCGGPMAGLLGAIYDFQLPSSGMTVKFPAERLEAVWGQPREMFVPPPCK